MQKICRSAIPAPYEPVGCGALDVYEPFDGKHLLAGMLMLIALQPGSSGVSTMRDAIDFTTGGTQRVRLPVVHSGRPVA